MKKKRLLHEIGGSISSMRNAWSIFFLGVNSVMDFADPLIKFGSSNARLSSIFGSSSVSPVLTGAINPSTLACADKVPTSSLTEYIKSPGRDCFRFSSTLRQIAC